MPSVRLLDCQPLPGMKVPPRRRPTVVPSVSGSLMSAGSSVMNPCAADQLLAAPSYSARTRHVYRVLPSRSRSTAHVVLLTSGDSATSAPPLFMTWKWYWKGGSPKVPFAADAVKVGRPEPVSF